MAHPHCHNLPCSLTLRLNIQSFSASRGIYRLIVACIPTNHMTSPETYITLQRNINATLVDHISAKKCLRADQLLVVLLMEPLSGGILLPVVLCG